MRKADIRIAVADGTESGRKVPTVQEPGKMPEEEKYGMAVYSWPGFEDDISRLWDKMCPEHPRMKILTSTEERPEKDLIAECIADNSISDDFLLLPPMSVPCAGMGVDELYLPVCFVDIRGEEHYSHRLPVRINKMLAAEVLARMTERSDEETMKEIYSDSRFRAVKVSFKSGNFVTPVLRGTPCRNVVMEALVLKKYIVANAVGMDAIKELLHNTIIT